MGELGKSRDEESGELEGDGATGGASRSKSCVWIRPSNGVADHKWEPLEEVGSGQNGE